jgi:hypothetical protein
MAAGFIKLMSISIFIAKQLENKILEILLSDYAQIKTSPKQFILIRLLCHCYSKNEDILNQPIYLILKRHIENNPGEICKRLLYL